jgi:uncharacterized Zn-binding protein involved in type VI secretion
MQGAARLDDPIAHTSALSGLIGGAIMGAVLALGAVAVLGTGGLAALLLLGVGAALTGAAAGAWVGEFVGSLSFFNQISGKIAAGSPDVFVNFKPLARAVADTGKCDKHGTEPPKIATGSGTVFVNGLPAARVDDKLGCSSFIIAGSPDVFIGGEQFHCDSVKLEDEVPWYYHGAVLVAGIGEIDHFRPKSRVQKCDLHPGSQHFGYWSLAYLFDNFRLCRELTNKRRKDPRDGKIYGKGTRFPLVDPSKRAASGTDDWKTESGLLLDPTNSDDVKLLRFDDRGNPISLNSDKTSLEYRCVQASIECYHLNEKEISDRRGDLCTKAKTMARRIVDLERKKERGEQYSRREIIEKKAELHEMIQPYAEFSSAVRCVLMQYRTSTSIKRILGIQND